MALHFLRLHSVDYGESGGEDFAGSYGCVRNRNACAGQSCSCVIDLDLDDVAQSRPELATEICVAA